MAGTEADNDIMERHGTKAGGLKAASVVGAAEVDILRGLRNAQRLRDSAANANDCEAYAFHRSHVRRAIAPGHSSTAAELLTIALADALRPDDGDGRHCLGRTSSKRNTRRLYGDPDLLRAAIAYMKRVNS